MEKMKFLFFAGVLVLVVFMADVAEAKLCNPLNENCGLYGRGRSAPTSPSRSSGISINPSAVPVEKGFGGEFIYYDSSFDVALVRGTGRVGAAISPTNGEESFFGPPGFENDIDYLDRQIAKGKFKSQKITLATAATVLANKKKGLKRVDVGLGVLGRYNRLSKAYDFGGGATVVAGPFTAGYALGNDEYVHVDPWDAKLRLRFPYQVETVSAGVSLSNVAIDWSRLKVIVENETPVLITLITGSIFVKRLILTAAQRIEESDRPVYDEDTESLILQRTKKNFFAGFQFAANDNILLGTFYNYYLLKELSLGLTVFF